MKTLTAAELLAKRRAELIADSERMNRRPAHVCRSAWRAENPIEYVDIDVKDTAFKTRPTRRLTFDLNGSLRDLWVLVHGRQGPRDRAHRFGIM